MPVLIKRNDESTVIPLEVLRKSFCPRVSIMVWLLPFVFLWAIVVVLPQAAGGEGRSGGDAAPDQLQQPDKLVIYLDVESTTYRARRRVSFGIGPILKSKLSAAGYAVTQERDSPHDLTLAIRYHETRGRQITLDLYGTDIACAITLTDHSDDRLLNLAIREFPDYADMITAPYVEVVDKLQANPYFYFLPDLVRGTAESHDDVTAILIAALERVLYPARHAVTPLDTLVSPAETFPDLDDHFSFAASQRTIQELGRLQDRRATDLLLKLTDHPDHAIRLEAVRALEGFPVPAVAAAIARVAREDTDVAVRAAARSVLTMLPAP